jgi:hypothetical protein
VVVEHTLQRGALRRIAVVALAYVMLFCIFGIVYVE